MGVQNSVCFGELLKRKAADDRLEPFRQAAIDAGVAARPRPTPNVTADLLLASLCGECGYPLHGVLSRAYVTAPTDFSVHVDGTCSKCLERRINIWRPLPADSAAAAEKQGEELEAMVRELLWEARAEAKVEVA